MWPDRVSNSGPLTCESGVLPTALRGPAYICGIYACLHTVLLILQMFQFVLTFQTCEHLTFHAQLS